MFNDFQSLELEILRDKLIKPRPMKLNGEEEGEDWEKQEDNE